MTNRIAERQLRVLEKCDQANRDRVMDEISSGIERTRMSLNSADSYRRDGHVQSLHRDLCFARTELAAAIRKVETYLAEVQK